MELIRKKQLLHIIKACKYNLYFITLYIIILSNCCFIGKKQKASILVQYKMKTVNGRRVGDLV